MPQLSVTDFSCIRSAELAVHPITILIGPQASGKSVLAKLLYFFSEILREQFEDAEQGHTSRVFKKNVAKKFSEWFPPSAWGRRVFTISYKAGEFECIIARKKKASNVSDEVVIEFSEFFEKQYGAALKAFRDFKKAAKTEDEFGEASFRRTWKVRSDSLRKLRLALGKEYIAQQIFVPAGRSFFTNLGKAFAMMEHGSPIDEVTKDFGRLFTHLLDGDVFYYSEKPKARVREFLKYQKLENNKIFGGEAKLSRNERHVITADGRRIPLSALSSGQQELLPLLLVIQHYTRLQAETDTSLSTLMYLEEPEAHLFPSSQGALTQHLAAISNFTAATGSMFITTHSPYVLTKLNTLIKAGMVAIKAPKAIEDIHEIVPTASWMMPDRVHAYSIQEGVLRSIMDESGLIDAEYLDRISDELSQDFMALLAIENQK